MGFVDSLLGIIGFGIGIPIGLVLGFFVFIYFQPRDVKEPVAKPFDELDSSSLIDLLPELPLWIMNPDYERVDWLNKFILDMWPYFDKAACKIIKSSAEATFAEYIGKYQIKSIDFERLTLGKLPPVIYGMKAQDSNVNELVFDIALKWAGNSDIALAIKLLSLQLSVQVVDIQVSALTRIVLKPFVPTFPCFSNIAVSLMEKPKIDFGLRVMGGDLMAIPGLYHTVQEIVRTQVAKLYLWPQAFEVEILDNSIGATKKPVGILQVKIVRARKLLKMDFLGKSDPYVKLSLSGEKLSAKKTSVKMNTLNPEWNEDFKLILKDPQLQDLQMHLFDWDEVGAHDFLGMQVVQLNQLTPYEKKEFTLNLVNSMDPNDPHNKKPRGQITLETTFVPFLEDSKKFSGILDYEGNPGSSIGQDNARFSGSGLLLVTVIGAKDVEGKHHNNSYVRITFKGDQKKTKSIKKTRDPYWNEEFEFVLDEAPLKDLIHLEVISKRRRIGFMSISSELDEEVEGGEEEGESLDFTGGEEPSFAPDLKLFVGNLPFTVDSAALAGLFEQAGNVEMVEVIYDKLTGRSRGFGFVTMSTAEEAEAAAQQFNGYELQGRALRVNSGPPPAKREDSSFRGPRGGGSSDNSNRVYVGNLAWGVDNLALETLFGEQGQVKEARVVYDRESGRSRGFGFVTYSSAEEVNNAIESLDGVDLNGRSIRVSPAEARPRREY
ncbi:hypothetical protein BUALT_Bualt11G0110800 [Buddleja alternifolia]|uniref:Synaptotagmin-3 n=1 Tax=Buddleja alternifolia TaxID=168488 RepID=A0AAV6WUZ8_9LAMI|nr:hypothetical protein BUALT_Bualt11G0110800 [Buddleja alternifolia]